MKLIVNTFMPVCGGEARECLSKVRSTVLAVGSGFFRAAKDGEAFEAVGGELFVSVLPVGEDAESAAFALDGSGRLTGCTAQCIRWADGCFELRVRLEPKIRKKPAPAQLCSLIFPTEGGRQAANMGRRRITLFRDDGLRLSVEEGGSEYSRYVCNGTDGKAHLLDIGRERLLVIHAAGCRRESTEAEPPPFAAGCGLCEKLVALNEKLEIVTALSGRSCRIENGYLTAIESLGTVLGHEVRTRHEFFGGELRKLPPETGFFTEPARMPTSPQETALALMQAVRLRREDEADALLSHELAQALSFDELCDFFGSFSDEKIVPPGFVEIKSENIAPTASTAVGALQKDENGLLRADKFVFEIKNGVVTDVEEAED